MAALKVYRAHGPMADPDDVALLEEKPMKRFMLEPNASIRRFLNPTLAVILMYGIVMGPYRVCFREPANLVVFVLEVLMDMIVIVDLVLNFRTVMTTGSGMEVKTPKDVATTYLSSWFLPDFLGAVPMDLFLSFKYGYQLNKLPLTVNMLRLVRLFKIFRLMRLYKTWLVFLKINSSVFRLMRLGVLIFLLTHYLACFWYLVGDLQAEEDSWVHVYAVAHSNTFSRYVTSFYWAIVTVTTVGYGDITPQNYNERVFNIFGTCLGVTAFSYAIGTMSYLVQRLEANSNQTQDRMDQVVAYMKYRKFPSELQQRIRTHYRHAFHRISAARDEARLLGELSHELRREVTGHLKQTILKNNAMFMSTSIEFASEIINRLSPQVAAPGDFIFHEGDHGEDMFFVNSGTVELCSDSGNVYQTVSEGDCFGEIAFFTSSGLQPCSARAHTHAELDVLSHTDFAEVVDKFPKEADDLGLVYKAHANLNKIASLQETFRAEEQTFDLAGLQERVSNRDRGVPVKDRVYRMRTYRNCFVATELVDWLIEHCDQMKGPTVKMRDNAVKIANMMYARGAFVRVTGQEGKFKDDFTFYKFVGAFELSPDQVDTVRKMIAAMDCRDRVYRFKKFSNCFAGCELVDWMVKTNPSRGKDEQKRRMAVQKCERYMARGAFMNSTGDTVFRDDYSLYTFNTKALDHASRTRRISLTARESAAELVSRMPTDNTTAGSLRRRRASSVAGHSVHDFSSVYTAMESVSSFEDVDGKRIMIVMTSKPDVTYLATIKVPTLTHVSRLVRQTCQITSDTRVEIFLVIKGRRMRLSEKVLSFIKEDDILEVECKVGSVQGTASGTPRFMACSSAMNAMMLPEEVEPSHEEVSSS